MKRLVLLLLCILGLSWVGRAQEVPTASYKNALLADLAGPGGYYTIQYERTVVDLNQGALALKAGFSLYHIQDFEGDFNPDYFIPLSFSSRWGGMHALELGLGTRFKSYVKFEDSGQKSNHRGLDYYSEIGYRFQKPGDRFVARLYYNPFFVNNNRFMHWGGLSLGWAF